MTQVLLVCLGACVLLAAVPASASVDQPAAAAASSSPSTTTAATAAPTTARAPLDLSNPNVSLNQLVNENAVVAPAPAPSASNGTEAPPAEEAAAQQKAKENKTKEDDDILPEAGAAEEEHLNSMAIFFVLVILALCILMIHYMIGSKLRYLPESLAVVFLGALIGLVLEILSKSGVADWQREEAFSPTVFFLVLLPPIIFESGYNLHKGNFFQNFGSILVFAVFGTVISALVVGGGVYLLGLADVAYHLSFVESFAFGSLISAVDPVATLAIFNALDVDPVLNMLVFGESILNDAVAIVLTTTVLESNSPAMAHMSSSEAVLHGVGRFCFMFVASAALGAVSALLAALLFKHVDLRNNPSLEFAMMLIFTYAPYGLAEGVRLSVQRAITMDPVLQLSAEEQERIRSWVPDPLVPPTPADHPALNPVIVDGKLGKYVSVKSRDLLNMATHNYLGMVGDARVEAAGIATLRKYGVGACGPRTFFGTIDVHLELEQHISGFLGTEETAIYSLGLSTVSSAIPAYAKPGDVLFVDEMAHFAIQKGVQASKSKALWFKHNDPADLERLIMETLKEQEKDAKPSTAATRLFIVVEGLYMNCGDICPLPEVVAVARRHKVRLFLDESVAIGVLGEHGRGTTEHFGVQVTDIDLICGSLEHALGSCGGFTSGSHHVVDHQRLNGLGYVFSASLPPMLASAASKALELMDNDATMTSRLRAVSELLHSALTSVKGLQLVGVPQSPIKHLRLQTSTGQRQDDQQLLQRIVDIVGIMAILFCGIVMSHYTHFNLSPVTQITMQQTMRTLAFVAETCVFAYLGLAIFSFGHQVEPALVIWSLVLCLLGRALNIFPLAALVNYFREHKITRKMQAIMWFSGLRGAIAYALCLHLEFGTEKRHVLVTTTLIVVLSSILLLGGATQPLLKYLSADRFSDDLRTRRRRRSRRQRDLNLSKTRELGAAIDSEHLSELTEDERDTNSNPAQLRGFAKWDYAYFKPFFTRRLTQQELREAKIQMTDLTNKVYETIRVSPEDSDDDEEELLA